VVASNQRQLFDKLLKEDLGFFANRHSSEFIARLTTGASSASQALNLLTKAGFRGKARRERSFQPDGLVFKQTPPPGKRSRQGTTVSFTIAFYPPRKQPPPPPAPAAALESSAVPSEVTR
jgi:beta-lactam-binding protein with PASTA domain